MRSSVASDSQCQVSVPVVIYGYGLERLRSALNSHFGRSLRSDCRPSFSTVEFTLPAKFRSLSRTAHGEANDLFERVYG